MSKNSIAVKKEVKKKKHEHLLKKIKACFEDADWSLLSERYQEDGSIALIAASGCRMPARFSSFVDRIEEVMEKIGAHYTWGVVGEQDVEKITGTYPALRASFEDVFTRNVTIDIYPRSECIPSRRI